MENYGKRWQLRFLAGLLAVFVTLYFTTDLFGGIYADDSPAVVDEIGEPGGEPAEIDEILPSEEAPAEDDENVPSEEEPAEGDENVPPEQDPAEDDENAPSEGEPAGDEENVPSEGESAEDDENAPSEEEPAGDEEIAEDDGIMLLDETLDPYFNIDNVSFSLNGQKVDPGDTVTVKNGDKVQFSFNWSIENISTTGWEGEEEFTYADFGAHLGNIRLPEGVLSGDLFNGTDASAHYVIHTDPVTGKVGALAVTITNQTGSFNNKGSIDLNGTVRFDQNATGGSLGLAGWTCDLINSTKYPDLSIYKDTTDYKGIQYENGSYYQYFTVWVENKSPETDATKVVLTDTYSDNYVNGSLEVIGATLQNGGGSVTTELDHGQNETVIKIDTLPKQEKLELTYRLKVDKPQTNLAVSGSNFKNTITAECDETDQVVTSGKDGWYTPPSITKSGTYNDNGDGTGTITWSITVNPGTLGAENPAFTVKDTLPNGLTLVDGGGTSLNLTKADFGSPDGNGNYTYGPFTTTAPKKTAFDQNVENTAALKIFNATHNGSGKVTIPGNGSLNIHKEHGLVTENGDTVTIPWEFTVTIPDADFDSITINDWASTPDNKGPNYQGYGGLKDRIAIDYTTFEVKVDGGKTYTIQNQPDNKDDFYTTGNNYTLVSGDGTVVSYALKLWHHQNLGFELSFAKPFLTEIKGKQLTVSYDMKVVSTEKDIITKVKNDATVTIGETSKPASADWQRSFSVTKDESYDRNIIPGDWSTPSNYNSVKGWNVKITNNSVTGNDNIILTDTLPEGYHWIEDAIKIVIVDQNYQTTVIDRGKITVTTTPYVYNAANNGAGNEILEITVDMNGGAFPEGATMTVSYCGYMDTGYLNAQLNGPGTQKNLPLHNEVVVEWNSQKGTASYDTTVFLSDNPMLIKKTTSEKRTGTKQLDATYALDINQKREKQNEGNPITVTDTLGSSLVLDKNSIVIYKYDEYGNQVGQVSVTPTFAEKDGHTSFSVTLDDATHYRIEYKVTSTHLLELKLLNPENVKEYLAEMSDDQIAALGGAANAEANLKAAVEAELTERYGNTATVSGTQPYSHGIQLDSNTFRFNTWYSYDFRITGKKIWPNSTDDLPDEIVFKLTTKETYAPKIAEAMGSDFKETVTYYHIVPRSNGRAAEIIDGIRHVYPETTVGADDTWSFNSEFLKSQDSKGSMYSYTFEEDVPDGYDATYVFTYTKNGLTTNTTTSDATSVEITGRTTVEIENQKVEVDASSSVQLLKTDASKKPLTGAEFTLTTRRALLKDVKVTPIDAIVERDPSGKKLTLRITADTGLTLSDLPAGGTYTLTETKAPAGYKSNPTPYTFQVLANGAISAKSAGYYTFTGSGQPTITVSNAPTEFSISKFAIGGTKQLDGAVLTITGNADLSKVTLKNGKIITAEDGKFEFRTNTKTAIITGLPKGNYTLTETAAPKGYEITSEFKFTMNEDGTITPGTTAENGTVNQYDAAAKTIKLYDAPKTGKITIRKVDDQSAPLAGAKFRLTPPTGISVNGAVVTGANVTSQTAAALEFETTGTDIEIDKLPVGKEYTLTEVNAPGGYSLAEDFLFEMKLNDDGDVSAASADPRFENGIAVIQDEKIVPGTLQLAKRGDGGAYLAGAKFTVTTTDGKLNTVTVSENAKVSVKEEKTLVFNITTAGIVTLGSLTEGTYTLTESAAPGGYIQNTSSFTFTVDQAGLISAGEKGSYTFNGATATLTNKITELRISKTDMTGKQQLPDATLTITKADGEGEKDFSNVTVENANFDKDDKTDTVTLVTGTETAVVKGLPAGKYVLTETAAPDGYAVTTKFGFTVNEDGTVTPDEDNVGNTYDEGEKTIRLVDEVIVVKIDKTDLGGNHLSGATIKILNKDGKSLGKVQVTGASGEVQQGLTSDTIEFTTGKEIAILTGLPKGNYVLTETAAPNDFQKTETEFHFKVNKHGKVGEDTTVGEPAKDILPNGNTITVLNEPIKKDDQNGSDDKKDPNGTTGSDDSQSSGSQSSDDPQSSGSQPSGSQPSGSQPSGSQPTGTRPSGGTRPTGTTAPTTITTAPTTASTSGGSTLTEPDETEPEKTTGKKTKETTEKPAAETTAKTKKTQKNTTAPETDPSKTTEPGTLQTDISIGINQVTRDPGIGIDSSQTVNEENPNTGVPFTSVAVVFAAAGALAIVTQKKKK